MRLGFALMAVWCSIAFVDGGGAKKRDWDPVELVGQASDFWFNRNWRSYYWREDFTFLLKDDAGKSWRIISREPTPAYIYRMGTTFTDLKVDWKANPRVKVIGVKAIDRIPADFYDFKLDEPNLATALAVYVETAANKWEPYFINNWFHQWGERADKAIYAHYTDKDRPYDIYGFARAQSAPFTPKSQEVIDANKDNPSLMFHGRIKSAKDNAFGYQIELIDLIGRNTKSGGHVILFGDAKTIPLQDNRKPDAK